MQKIIQRALWSPHSYRNFKAHLSYFEHNNPIFQQLHNMPPIVSIQKIEQAKKQATLCQQGKATFLHMGDCAEPFEHAEESILSRKIGFMRQCRDLLGKRQGKPVMVVGRIAGQYAKPRSSQFVVIDGIKIHNYKGDNINSTHEHDRDPCTKKLLTGYYNSLSSAKQICQQFPQLYISHQGLVLPYEASLTRQKDGLFYCQSAHMVWIGERTRQLNGAHVEFFRGVENLVGVKVSSDIDGKDFVRLVTMLNPRNKKGKLLVIVRMGRQNIKKKFEELVKIKNNEGLNFLFVSDPMHGNTFDSKIAKVKTRSLDHILQQINYFKETLNDKKIGYGFSLQSTFEDVTECFGLQFPIKQSQISKQLYKSKCDPRLNRGQTLKLLELLSA